MHRDKSAAVVRIVFALLVLYAIFGFIRKAVSAQCRRGRYTSGISGPQFPWWYAIKPHVPFVLYSGTLPDIMGNGMRVVGDCLVIGKSDAAPCLDSVRAAVMDKTG